MARSISEIQQSIIDDLESNGIAVSDSKLSRRRIMTYVVSVAIYSVERLFDLHKEEVTKAIKTERARKLLWYQQKGLAFQYGFALPSDSDEYDNTGVSEEDILNSKIISQCAVSEPGGKVRFKIVKTVDNEFTLLTVGELSAFITYMNKVRDVGVKILASSLPPDELRIELDVFYDPLVINSNGDYIDGSISQPVPKEIQSYLKELPFNGEYASTRLIDRTQKLRGVVLLNLKSAEVKYGTFPFGTIDERYIPDSGYFILPPENLTVNYRPYV